jgi:hypothetical protein
LHTYQKISLNERNLVTQPSLLGQASRDINLLLIDCDADDVAADGFSILARWTTNTASDVENPHTGLQAHKVGEAVLLKGHCLQDGLAGCEGAIVEVLAPSLEVGCCDEVVVSEVEEG